MRGEKSVHDSRIGAEPFVHCETWDILVKITKDKIQNLDHGREATAKNEGGARQEPRHPPARCPETRQRKKPAKQQHDPIFNSKTIYTRLPHAVTCCSWTKMAKFYRMMHVWNSNPVLSLKREHGLPRMTPGCPHSGIPVVHQCRVETSVHHSSFFCSQANWFM